MTSLQQLALDIAISNIGRREATGHNDGPFVRMLQLLAVDGGHNMEGEPWCAMFATYCIRQAAAELGLSIKVKLSPSSTYIYSCAKQDGLLLAVPVAGCIGLIRAPAGSGKTHDHTFFVEATSELVKPLVVFSIDGNWCNQVKQTVHLIDKCDFVSIV